MSTVEEWEIAEAWEIAEGSEPDGSQGYYAVGPYRTTEAEARADAVLARAAGGAAAGLKIDVDLDFATGWAGRFVTALKTTIVDRADVARDLALAIRELVRDEHERAFAAGVLSVVPELGALHALADQVERFHVDCGHDIEGAASQCDAICAAWKGWKTSKSGNQSAQSPGDETLAEPQALTAEVARASGNDAKGGAVANGPNAGAGGDGQVVRDVGERPEPYEYEKTLIGSITYSTADEEARAGHIPTRRFARGPARVGVSSLGWLGAPAKDTAVTLTVAQPAEPRESLDGDFVEVSMTPEQARSVGHWLITRASWLEGSS